MYVLWSKRAQVCLGSLLAPRLESICHAPWNPYPSRDNGVPKSRATGRNGILLVSSFSTFFFPSFQLVTDPKIEILPAPMLTSNWRDAYPTQTLRPLRLRRLPAHRPERNPLRCCRRPRRGAVDRFASQNFPPSPQPEAKKGVIPTPGIHPALGVCVTTPPAQAASRPPVRFSTPPHAAPPARLW